VHEHKTHECVVPMHPYIAYATVKALVAIHHPFFALNYAIHKSITLSYHYVMLQSSEQ